MLVEGAPAPAFEAPDQQGVVRSSEKFRGAWLLLYFYPKDDTPGCTTEACGLRDSFEEFQKRGVRIVGVSADSVKSHAAFVQKYALPFIVLSDEEKRIVQAYGVWQEKSMYGKTYMGIVRSSFLVDPHGIIRKIYPKVQPERHAAEILADMQTLEEGGVS